MLVWVAGCGGGALVNPPVEILPPFEFGAVPEPLWQQKIGGWEPDVKIALVADKNHLYTANQDGVQALALDSGKIVWEGEIGEVSGGLHLAQGDKLVVSTFEGNLLALASADGEPIWSQEASGEVLAPASSSGDQLVVQTNNGRVISMQADSGKVNWILQQSTPALSLRGTAAPMLFRGRIFYMDDSCKARMLNAADGNAIWERVLTIPEGSNEIDQLVDGDSQPVLLGSDLYVACYNGYLVKMDANTGNEAWRRAISVRHNLISAGASLVLVEDSTSDLVAYDAISGRRQWKRPELGYRKLSTPIYWQRQIFIGDHEGYIHVLNPANGDIVARFRPFKSEVRTLFGQGDRLYAVDSNGEVRAFQNQP